jgi:hypothetical protein
MARTIPDLPHRWEFRGASGPRSKDDRDRGIGRIADALRSASAWPVDVTIRWTAGRSASLRLQAADAATARWLAGSLVPAYPPGAWVAESGPDSGRRDRWSHPGSTPSRPRCSFYRERRPSSGGFALSVRPGRRRCPRPP